MLGKILIYLTTIAGLLSVILYFLSDKNSDYKKYASVLYYIATASIIGAGIYLLYNIMIHNFQFTYIWEYSSRELHDYFLFATFYSGQQGSFMLWIIILAVLGLFVKSSAKKNNLESYAMAFYTLVILFVAVILIFKSPFDYVWETFASDKLEVGYMPTNGRGLNPILQNYWITIHPPILFVGYALMTVPFVYALAALIKKEYKGWIEYIMSWSLIGGGILGLGIMMGGFWAYETLGWGGFWAWDPVENSSLIPWIFIVAFVHTILVQRRTGGLVKTNFFLGMMSFIFVLYATFLTRSGILGETSVHSFVTPGAVVYALLVIFMLTFTLLGLFFIIFRYKDINKFLEKSNFKPVSKEYSLTLGSILLLALGIVVIMGTSWPAVAEIFGQPKVAIDISNYNRFGSVFAIIFLLINGISLYQRWMSSKLDDLFNKVLIPLIATLAITITLFFVGLKEINFLLLTFSALFSLLTNLDFLVRNIIKEPRKIGSYISHLGVAILILGAVASGGYSMTQHMSLKFNETKSAFGYDFTLVKKTRIEQDFKDREKYNYHVKITKENNESMVKPVVYWSNFNEWQAPFLEPGIYSKIEKDVYISPKAVETDFNIPSIRLMKNSSDVNPFDKQMNIKIKSLWFDEKSSFSDGRVLFGTILEISKEGKVSVDTVMTMIDPNTWEGNFDAWTKLKDYDYAVNMIRIIRDMNDVANSQLEFFIRKSNEPMPEPTEVFAFDVSLKPFINLVWIGTIANVLGFFIALTRYTKGRKNEKTKNNQ